MENHLGGYTPPIWRRVLVNSSSSLADLHWIIQIAMGWTNSHLHQFRHGGEFYQTPDPFDDGLGFMDALDSSQYRIDRLLTRKKTTCVTNMILVMVGYIKLCWKKYYPPMTR
ncbi:plasmid pRiA4b ORF-3 family protein [Candidatus Thiothrix anitrata]|uniref:Plasmid pRiA4b ORF-3 family protein n=1 Tax=Candidatus Thiothrix anitrata TaxID=2823902 RepID=A0ABX7X9B2_9GAMM|nr:plasmid pRiA4b ORF-3 family protein [Candidatus Thiothrix anitrata]